MVHVRFSCFAVFNYGHVSGTVQKAAYPGEAILWKYAVGKEVDQNYPIGVYSRLCSSENRWNRTQHRIIAIPTFCVLDTIYRPHHMANHPIEIRTARNT